MAFFSKAFDRLKGALKKTAQILNTDVRTLFVPGRQINEEILTEMRDRWRLGKIKNRDQCQEVIRDEMLRGWDTTSRELTFAPTGHPTVILVAGVNGAGKTTSIAKLAWYFKTELKKKVMVA